jgi:hypothetical protein
MVSFGFLLVFSLPLTAMGWGTVFDTFRVGYGTSTALRLRSSDTDDDFDSQNRLGSLEKAYGSLDADFHEEILVRGAVYGGEPVLWDASLFGDDSSFDFEFPCGEDCDDCLIPEEYKIDARENIDVMAFLGIRRADSIEAKRLPVPQPWQ